MRASEAGRLVAIAVVNDGTVMRRSKRRERAEATVTRLRPIFPWLLLLAVVVIVAVTWPLTRWLYGIAGDDPARRIEAIKTGLTVAAGTGGAFALLLAFRRQLATEIIATETREAQERSTSSGIERPMPASGTRSRDGSLSCTRRLPISWEARRRRCG